jgi:hypothetical protein
VLTPTVGAAPLTLVVSVGLELVTGVLVGVLGVLAVGEAVTGERVVVVLVTGARVFVVVVVEGEDVGVIVAVLVVPAVPPETVVVETEPVLVDIIDVIPPVLEVGREPLGDIVAAPSPPKPGADVIDELIGEIVGEEGTGVSIEDAIAGEGIIIIIDERFPPTV